MIYFIQNQITGRIKIGYSKEPDCRIKNLQTGNDAELKVLFSIPGGYKEETELRKRFKHLHYRGEWYDCKAELAEYIESVKPSEVEFIKDFNFSDSGENFMSSEVPWELVKVSLATEDKKKFTGKEERILMEYESYDEKTPYSLIGCLLFLIIALGFIAFYQKK